MNSISGIRPPRQRTQKNKQTSEKDSLTDTKPTKLQPVKEKLPDQGEEKDTEKVNRACTQSQTTHVTMCSSTSQTPNPDTTDNCSQTDDTFEVRENDRQIFVIGKFCAVQQSSGLWLINPPAVREST